MRVVTLRRSAIPRLNVCHSELEPTLFGRFDSLDLSAGIRLRVEPDFRQDRQIEPWGTSLPVITKRRHVILTTLLKNGTKY